MDRSLNQLGFIGLGASVIGLFLSFMLILEYYGSSGAVGESLCGAGGSVSSCQEVAESSYSAIRGVPGMGEIPIAILGFGFYGLMGFGFFQLGTAKSEERFRSFVNILFPLVIFGILVDLALLLVSVLLIQAICSMCIMTYVVTSVLFAMLFIGRKKTEGIQGDSIMDGVKKNGMNFAIAFLAFFAVGLVTGRSLSAGPESLGNSNATGSVDIQAFESQPQRNFNTEGSAVRGSKNAPITIVEFADYNCGHCMHAAHILDQMLTEFDGMVKVVYMNFPLDGNCNRLVGRQAPGASSCVAAMAAICGDKQGKFSDIHHGLYKDNENGVMHSTPSVMNAASKVGLDMGKFRSCMSSNQIRSQINKEVDEAEKVQINSTPTIFINGKAIPPGTPDPNYLRKLLRHLVNKA